MLKLKQLDSMKALAKTYYNQIKPKFSIGDLVKKKDIYGIICSIDYTTFGQPQYKIIKEDFTVSDFIWEDDLQLESELENIIVTSKYGCKLYYTKEGDLSWSFSALKNKINKNEIIYPRLVKSRRDIVKLLSGASTRMGYRCFNKAWIMAVESGSVDHSKRFKIGEELDGQTIEYAQQEYEQVEYYISLLVNNPNSKFYLMGKM